MNTAIRKYQNADRQQCRSLWRELTEWHQEIYEDPTIGGEHPEDYFDKYLSKLKPARIWFAVRSAPFFLPAKTPSNTNISVFATAFNKYKHSSRSFVMTVCQRTYVAFETDV